MKITLEAILRALSHESLSFMSDSNSSNGTIEADQIPKVIGRINGILRRLAVKFVLNEKTVKINVTNDRRYYPIVSGSSWIATDPTNPFIGDVNRILGIKVPNGRMYNLNDRSVHDNIMLRDEGTGFFLKDYMEVGVYEVIYKAATPQFTESPKPDLSQELNIPEALLNALYAGVAAMTYEGIGGAEHIQIAKSKWAQFNSDCADARINSAVEVEEFEDVNKLLNRGFC